MCVRSLTLMMCFYSLQTRIRPKVCFAPMSENILNKTACTLQCKNQKIFALCILWYQDLIFLFHMEYKKESQKIDLHNHLYTGDMNIDTIPKVINQSQLSILSTSGQISKYLNICFHLPRLIHCTAVANTPQGCRK